jgi:hypothetical protein
MGKMILYPGNEFSNPVNKGVFPQGYGKFLLIHTAGEGATKLLRISLAAPWDVAQVRQVPFFGSATIALRILYPSGTEFPDFRETCTPYFDSSILPIDSDIVGKAYFLLV